MDDRSFLDNIKSFLSRNTALIIKLAVFTVAVIMFFIAQFVCLNNKDVSSAIVFAVISCAFGAYGLYLSISQVDDT